MSKKVSFKRPKKPNPAEADAWVQAEPAEQPIPAADQSGDRPPTANAISSRHVAQRPVRLTVEQQSLINELRWFRQIIGSLARQVELMSDRVERSALDRRMMAQPTPEQLELQREIAGKSARVIEQMSAFRKALDRD